MVMLVVYLGLVIISTIVVHVDGQSLIWTATQNVISDEPIAIYKKNIGLQDEMVLRNASIHVLTTEEFDHVCVAETLPPELEPFRENLVLFLDATFSPTCHGKFGLGSDLTYVNKWCGLGVPMIFQVIKYHPGVLINNRPSKNSPQWQEWVRLKDAHCWATRLKLQEMGSDLEQDTVDIVVTNEAQEMFDRTIVQVYFRGVAPLLYFAIICQSVRHFYARRKIKKLPRIHKAILLLNVVAFSVLTFCAADFGLFYVTDNIDNVGQLTTMTALSGLRSAGDYLLVVLYDQNIKATFKRSAYRMSDARLWIACAVLSVFTDAFPLIFFLLGLEGVSLISIVGGGLVAIMQTCCVISLTKKTLQLTALFRQFSDEMSNKGAVSRQLKLLAKRLKKCVILNIICSIFAILLSIVFAFTPLVFGHLQTYLISFFLFSLAGFGNAFAQTMACAEPPKVDNKHHGHSTAAITPSNTGSCDEF